MDVSTRWNSTFDMTSRFLEMNTAVYSVLRLKEIGREKDAGMKSLDETELQLLEDMQQVLKPLKDITVALCSESYLTVSVILPLQHQLLSKVLIEKDTDSPEIASMQSVLRNDLKDRYNDIRQKQLLYTAIDPRFKQLPFL